MSDKIVSYEQFEQVSNKIKQYVDDSVIFTQELLNDNINSYIATTKEEINILLANNYSSLETFLEYSDALSTSFQLLQYGVNLKFETLNENIEGVYSELLDLKKDLDRNIILDPVSMTIQQKDSKYGFMVAEKEINFTEGKDKVGVIANNEWQMNNVDVGDSLAIGPFKFTNKKNGHITFTWDDGGNIVRYYDSYKTISNDQINPGTGDAHWAHKYSLINKISKGEIYTVELCSNVPQTKGYDDMDNFWVLNDLSNSYDNISDSDIIGLKYEYYFDGIAKKSFKAKMDTDYVGLHLLYDEPDAKYISYLKIYEGDDCWRDTHNMLSYNNVYTEANKCVHKQIRGCEVQDMLVYGYLDTDTVYNFSCFTDGEWGETVGEDTIYLYLCHDDGNNFDRYDANRFDVEAEPEWFDEANMIKLTEDYTFTVPKSGRWSLFFGVYKEDVEHSFWDARIDKLGTVAEIYEDSEIPEGEEIIEDEEIVEGGDE